MNDKYTEDEQVVIRALDGMTWFMLDGECQAEKFEHYALSNPEVHISCQAKKGSWGFDNE